MYPLRERHQRRKFGDMWEGPNMEQATRPVAAGDTMASGNDAAEVDAPGGNIVAIEQGRDRRDKRGTRLDKSDRKALRRSNRSSAASSADSDDDAEAGSVAETMAEGIGTEVLTGTESADGIAAAAAIVAAEPEHSLMLATDADSTMLVAPLVDTASGQKLVERTRAQFHAAETAVASNPEVIAVVAPLIRHVNGVTEQLNDAQINLGRIMAERDALRARLAQVEGVDVSDLAIVPMSDLSVASGDKHGSRLQRLESHRPEDASKSKSGKSSSLNPLKVDPLSTREEMARVARRRQLLAIALFGAVGILLYINGREGNDISKISRDSLADLQFVGVFFNMFFMVWMLYRVVRVGGKGAKWLFPHNQAQRRH